ncbi:phosphate/phosphite/phosphonate ABC transporter substrate-binding protein [Brevibacterium sp. 5221]|uniref:Phosphate/phosphite/phosphonate ABC transporter substrate-binding protein n=1 Tax=Brevibacterium rongguiense TaxID=2695267 RepID=A0A6N9H9U0_9MICO|nr:phosphate/phosphite/phosphonate ABC transporter substrate-binding protein [Brevibacterium rongguiense]MYM20294.1 phosphate/phosphite/phosphonate ABC transporter substrate-binding protein [Brevibacterium rongguiense]
MRTPAAALSALSAVSLFALAACGPSAAQGSSGSGDSDPDTLVFTAIPSEESQSLSQQFKIVISEIEKATGKKVQVQSATDYAGVIEAQRAGKVQLANYGPLSYVAAHDSGVGLDILGGQITEKDGKPGYNSFGVVPADSPIKSLDDLKGKKVCFVDPTSTSGYLYPSAALQKAGIDPKKDVSPIMAGGHDSSALSVAKGSCDAGFAEDAVVNGSLIKSGQLKKGQLREIWKSELIPATPVAASDSLSQDLRDKLKQVFTQTLNKDALVKAGTCTSAKDCELPEDSWGYVPLEDSAYDSVRKVCEATKADSCVKG